LFDVPLDSPLIMGEERSLYSKKTTRW